MRCARTCPIGCHVCAHAGIALVQEVGRGDEAHQAARAEHIKRPANEPVVDARSAVRPVAVVHHAVAAEGNIGQDEVVGSFGQGRGLEATDPHINPAGPVEAAKDAARDAVQLDRCDAAALGNVGRHAAKEVPDAGARFEDVAALETQAAQGCPDPVDDDGVGVVAVVDRCPRRVVVVGREQLAQATGSLDPGWIPAFVVEARRDAAPAGVAQQCATFAGARLPGFALDRAKRVDGRHVGVELGRLAFDVVEDLVVPCRPLEQLRGMGRGGHGGTPCLGDLHFLDCLDFDCGGRGLRSFSEQVGVCRGFGVEAR